MKKDVRLPIGGICQTHDPHFVCDEILIVLIELLIRLVWCHFYPVVQFRTAGLQQQQQNVFGLIAKEHLGFKFLAILSV